MTDRWPAFHEPALRWLSKVERSIVRCDHPEQGAFIAIVNAIEFQFEIGADRQATELLLAALRALAASQSLPLKDLLLDAKPASILDNLDPKRSLTR